MFGSAAGKLSKFCEKAMKEAKAGNLEQVKKQIDAALKFIEERKTEASREFLSHSVQIALMLIGFEEVQMALSLFDEVIERCERHGKDKSALYAAACRVFAATLREHTEGEQRKIRELLEKGLRCALQGEKQDLTGLLYVLPEYLAELKENGLSEWMPRLLDKAREAYGKHHGENSTAMARMLMLFSEALKDADLPNGKALALDAIEQSYTICEKAKPEDELMMEVTNSKAGLLQRNGKASQATQFLRSLLDKLQGEELLELCMLLARLELRTGLNISKVEAILHQGLEAVKKEPINYKSAPALGLLGICAGVKGDEAAVSQYVEQISSILAKAPKDLDNATKASMTMSLFDSMARGLFYGGRHESALRLVDRALEQEANLEKDFGGELQEALQAKALILCSLGRQQEAETLIFDKVLERLDDINKLDSSSHINALIELSNLLIEKREFRQAQATLKSTWEMCVQCKGKNTAGNIYLMMGKLFMRTNQHAKAKEVLARGREMLLAFGEAGLRARSIFKEFSQLGASQKPL